MPSLARFVLMITIATAVTAGLHYYAYVRLARYLVLPPPELRILKAVLLGLFALLWLSMPLGRSLPRSVGTPLLWLAYIWMGALVVLDNTSGEVLAWVGSSGVELSRAAAVDGVLARRQAGSTLKPFLYELAIEQRWLTAASLVDDSPLGLDAAGGLVARSRRSRCALDTGACHAPERAGSARPRQF